MKVTAVKKYAEPGFPTHSILDEHPELLRIVPKRWRGNPVVLAALTTVCLLIFGSRSQADRVSADRMSRIAPIFEYGSGRGTFGCVATNPPVFLSEDEARQVIIEEGKKARILFSADAPTLLKVPVPITDRYSVWVGSDKGEEKPKTRVLDLQLDGIDKQRKIGFEYVSSADFEEWERKDYTMACSVYGYDYLGTAKVLREGLQQARPRGAYAVFYDPAATAPMKRYSADEFSKIDWEAEHKRLEAESRRLSCEQLRKQVQDFIKWLKAQGVI